jgi:hypothetical protein
MTAHSGRLARIVATQSASISMPPANVKPAASSP